MEFSSHDTPLPVSNIADLYNVKQKLDFYLDIFEKKATPYHELAEAFEALYHDNFIQITNPFEQGIGGNVRLVGTKDWRILPLKVDYKLSSGEESKRPFQIRLNFDANSGTSTIRADFELDADKKYQFSLYRDIRVGDDEI